MVDGVWKMWVAASQQAPVGFLHDAAREEIEDAFRFNDAVLRHMVVARHKADTDPSPLAKNAEKSEDRKSEDRSPA